MVALACLAGGAVVAPAAHAAPLAMQAEHAGAGARQADDDLPTQATDLVRLAGQTDAPLHFLGHIGFHVLAGDTVNATNDVEADTTCARCTDVVIGLQLNVVRPGARLIVSEQVSTAITTNACQACATEVIAIQFTMAELVPFAIPPDVSAQVLQIDHGMDALEAPHQATVADAQSVVDTVIAQFGALQQELIGVRTPALQSSAGDPPVAPVMTGGPASPASIPATPIALTSLPDGVSAPVACDSRPGTTVTES